jgi:hypothetical protein
VSDQPLNDSAARQWPLEGQIVIGGSWGLQVHTECLGCTFTSRTASHDLEIGLLQRDTESAIPEPPERFQHILGPPVPNMELVPPKWAYGPVNDQERQEERMVNPVWGTTLGPDRRSRHPGVLAKHRAGHPLPVLYDRRSVR